MGSGRNERQPQLLTPAQRRIAHAGLEKLSGAPPPIGDLTEPAGVALAKLGDVTVPDSYDLAMDRDEIRESRRAVVLQERSGELAPNQARQLLEALDRQQQFTNRRTNRRRFMRGGLVAGTTLVLAASGLGYRKATEPEPPKPVDFDVDLDPSVAFDVNNVISPSDWEGIFAKITEDAEKAYKTLPDWKSHIALVNPEMASRIQLKESDWDSQLTSLEVSAESSNWDRFVLDAMETKLAFPDRQQELHGLIDPFKDSMFGSLSDPQGGVVNHPSLGFSLCVILYPQEEIQLRDDQKNTLAETLYRFEGRGDMLNVVGLLADLKHFAPEMLPPFSSDGNFIVSARRYTVGTLRELRENGYWRNFIYTARDSRLFEADTIVMTPDGIQIS